MKTTCFLLASLASVTLSVGCVGEVGPQGPEGPQGQPGMMGASGNAANTFPDCPIGYIRDLSVPNIVLCKQGVDEVVKVGRKGSAFWIDRYEASVWDKED